MISKDRSNICDVKLLAPDDCGYVSWCRGKRLEKARAKVSSVYIGRDPRQEFGDLMESLALEWLGKYVTFQKERILSWKDFTKPGNVYTGYREIDGVVNLGCSGLILYECKCVSPKQVKNNLGIQQLNTAKSILGESTKIRLVYIVEKVPTESLRTIAPDDTVRSRGVIWITYDEIESLARSKGIVLPKGWKDPVTRYKDNWESYIESRTKAPVNTVMGLAIQKFLSKNKEKLALSVSTGKEDSLISN